MLELAAPAGVVPEQPGQSAEVHVGTENVALEFELPLEVPPGPAEQAEVVGRPSGQGMPGGACIGPGESGGGGHGPEKVGRTRGAGNGDQPSPTDRFPESPGQVRLNAGGPSCRYIHDVPTGTHTDPLMALKGDLASVDLAQVFQMLALNKKAGLLSIQSPRLWKVLHFGPRGVTLYFNQHSMLEKCLRALLRRGSLLPRTLEEVREHAATQGADLMQTLQAGGFIDPAELESLMAVEIEEEIHELFFCRDARFEFHEGIDRLEELEGVVDERFSINADSIVMEAARRIDEWSYISERIPSQQAVMDRSAAVYDEEDAESTNRIVYDLVDGRRSIARIVELSGQSSFVVSKALAQLLDSGHVEPLPAESLIEVGNQCLTEGRLPEAINLFEQSVASGVGMPEVHSLAASAYESAREFGMAALHLGREAELHLVAGDFAAAATKLRASLDLVPTDLKVREQLVQIAIEDPKLANGLDPVAEGRTLAQLLLEVGEVDRATPILEHLMQLEPRDIELKKTLVNAYGKHGDSHRISPLYESIAEDLVAAGRPMEAIGYLQKVLMIDRTRTDVSARVRNLYENDERVRSRRRRLASLGIAFLLLAFLGLAFHVYERIASRELAAVDVSQLVASHDYASAAITYDRFAQAFPLSSASRAAELEATRIRDLGARRDRGLQLEKVARDRQLADVRARYKADWARHRSMFLAGDAEGSLRTLLEVEALLATAGEDEDRRWAATERVSQTIADIRGYLERADALATQVRELFERGSWQQSRQVALELLQRHELAGSARAVNLPMQVVSRPAGARILAAGQPVLSESGVELRTPAVVCLKGGQPQVLTIELDGHEPLTVRADARKVDQVDLLLTRQPATSIRFPHAPQSVLAATGDHVGIGLRGGRFGIARSGESTAQQVVDLGDLRSLDGPPVASGELLWYLTDDGIVHGLDFTPGPVPQHRSFSLGGTAATGIASAGGRLFVVDGANRLVCHDARNGNRLWSVALDSEPAGIPVSDGRQVWVGTHDGRVRCIDVKTSSQVLAWRDAAAPVTSIRLAGGRAIFACSDGTLRALEADGRQAWNRPLGRNLADGELALAGGAIVARTGSRELAAFDIATGEQVASASTDGDIVGPLAAIGDKVCLVVRIAEDGGRRVADTLRALDPNSLVAQWQARLPAAVSGPLSEAVSRLHVPLVDGQLLVFRD